MSVAYRIYIILFHCSSLQISGVGFGQTKTFLTLKTSSLQTLMREAFMCGSPAAKASPWRHSPPSSDPQYPTLQRHLVQPSATGDVTEKRCTIFLLYKRYAHRFYTPTAKTRMKGLLLPNLDVHLSLQAPSKGCSKNPRKKKSPVSSIFLQAGFTGKLK